MAKKTGVKLPRHDRSRSLPVRRGWGLWKTLAVATAVAMAAWIFNGPDTPPQAPPVPAVIEAR